MSDNLTSHTQTDSARSRRLARILRATSGAALLWWITAALIAPMPVPTYHPLLAVAGGFAFGLPLLRIAHLIERDVSRVSERPDEARKMERWSRASHAKVLGRLGSSALATILVPALLLFANVFFLIAGAFLGDKLLGATVSTMVFTALFSMIALLPYFGLYFAARTIALFAARQTDIAQLDEQLITHVERAREVQAGALSLDVQRGEHGGLTEIDAAAGGLDALADHDGDVDDVLLDFDMDEGVAVEARHVVETVESS